MPVPAETGATPIADTSTTPVASVVIVATDELHHLQDCLPTLAAQVECCTEVMVIDNASSDGTADVLASTYPWVSVVRVEERLGYAAANNLGFQHALGEYLIVLNPDTRVDPGFVGSLVRVCQEHQDRVLVTSRICLFDDPMTINTAGIDVHFGLLSACRGLGAARSCFEKQEEVASISGCAFLVSRSVLKDIGPFDEMIYPYLEDTELSLRARVHGYSCVLAPESLVYHKYSLRMLPRKFFYIERNRWLVMLRLYRWRTLAVLAPALLMLETLAWVYALRRGRAHALAKARSYLEILRLMPVVQQSRRQVQASRVVGDRVLLARMQGKLPISALLSDVSVPSWPLIWVNHLLSGYLALARRVVGG